MTFERDENNILKVCFPEKITSTEAPDVDNEFAELLAGGECAGVEIDAKDLQYISSAGLRVLLKVKKQVGSVKMTGVSDEVYTVLDMTGVADLLEVEKA